MVRVIEGLASDWHRLDERIEGLSSEIEELAKRDAGCERLMSIPGIGPIISSAMVAAIGTGDSFSKGRGRPTSRMSSVLNSKQISRVTSEDFRFVLRLDRGGSDEFHSFGI